MAGALRYFPYVSDSAATFGVRLDRTNSVGTTTVGALPLFTTLAGGAPVGAAAPKGLKLRYCNSYSADNPKIKRRLYVGNLAAWTALLAQVNPSISLEGYPGNDDTPGTQEVFLISSFVGEKRLRIPNSSTIGAGLPN